MGIAQLDAKGLSRVDTGIHAGEDEVLLCRGQSEVAFGERGGVGLRGGFDVLLDGAHGGGGGLVLVLEQGGLMCVCVCCVWEWTMGMVIVTLDGV